MTDTTTDATTDTPSATADPPADPARPIGWELYNWRATATGVELFLTPVTPADRERLEALRRAAAGEWVSALEGVKAAFADTPEARTARDARAAVGERDTRADDATSQVKELENQHARALRTPKEWDRLESLEADIERAKEEVRRLRSRNTLIDREAKRLERDAATTLHRELEAALRGFTAVANDKDDAATAALATAAGNALTALLVASARRPNLIDGGKPFSDNWLGFRRSSKSGRNLSGRSGRGKKPTPAAGERGGPLYGS